MCRTVSRVDYWIPGDHEVLKLEAGDRQMSGIGEEFGVDVYGSIEG